VATTDFKAYIKKRSGFFFGDRGINALDICSEISKGAMALGAKKVEIGIIESWHYICADEDWISIELKHPYENRLDVFERMSPFPEYFANSTRYEPMTKFFSDALITSNGTEVELVKGKEPDIRLFEKDFQSYSTWRRVVAFKFNEHA
jgi:hypothetical protein